MALRLRIWQEYLPNSVNPIVDSALHYVPRQAVSNWPDQGNSVEMHVPLFSEIMRNRRVSCPNANSYSTGVCIQIYELSMVLNGHLRVNYSSPCTVQ